MTSRETLALLAVGLPAVTALAVAVNMILRAASYFTDKESASRDRCLVWPLAA